MAAPSTTDPVKHYNFVADAWRYLLGEDLHYGYFERPDTPLAEATAALTGLMLRHADLSPGVRVLDVGCGRGHPAVQMAERYGCTVLGISTSSVCVERANQRAVQRGVAELARFEVRDGMDTQLAAGSFDRIWVMEASHLMPAKDRLLRETARLLKPGGKLILCDIMLRRPLQFPEVLERRADLQTLDAVFGKATMLEMAAYARLAEQAGYDVAAQLDISAEVQPTFDRWRENADTCRNEVESLIGPAALRQFRASAGILSRFWAEGWLGYGLLEAKLKA
ncbi:MAG: class I SAM-dependent methyltransferase [Paludibaculum sp.]